MDTEEGPSRRISRGRRRTPLENIQKDNIPIQTRSSRRKSGQSSDVPKPDWFANSFQSDRHNVAHQDKHKKTQVTSSQRQQPVFSSPKSKRLKTDDHLRDSLNTSDALLADLDIETIATEALSQSQNTTTLCNGNVNRNTSHTSDRSVENGIENLGSGLQHTNSLKTSQHSSQGGNNVYVSKIDKGGAKNVSVIKSCTQELESQYFSAKFGNYKPTQTHGRKEVTIDSGFANGSKTENDESTFSFSFVGEDTFCGSQTQVTMSQNGVPSCPACCNSATGSSSGMICSCSTPASHLQEHIKRLGSKIHVNSSERETDRQFRCTPYFKTDNLSVSIVDTQTQDQIDSTQTRSETQTQISIVDTTQLKDHEGFKYRCTPFKKITKDLCTQTQTQSELVSGTQYNSYMQNDSSQIPGTIQNSSPPFTQKGDYVGTPCTSSQFPSTGLCNMTGAFIDTQDDTNDIRAANTSCDVFDDSYCENGDKLLSTTQMMSSLQADLEISSHTQSLSRNLKATQQTDPMVVDKRTGDNPPGKESRTNSGHKYLDKPGDHNLINQSAVGSRLVHSQAMNFGEKTKTVYQSMSEHDTMVPKTPGQGAGSLQEKIKKRLMENAGRRTPQGPGALVEQLRAQVMERVQLEAEIRKERADSDIGPFYGLPTKVKHLFENYRGIKTLYDWQDECLKLPALVKRHNLIYSLPTSGGKTLVAEILILQELLCHKRDALLILPFVSIVQEKVRNMSQFAVDLNFFVEEYAGSKGRFPPIKRRNNRSLYIATIEKAQSIVNSLIETDRFENLGLVVVDELHMLGEGGKRGSTLESTLMKILHAGGLTQIIGMSATLNNIEDIKKFLNADVYSNDFRPVTLTEYVKLTECVYKVEQTAKCPEDQFVHDRVVNFQYLPEMSRTDPDHLLGLVLEVIPDNSCLVFCPTKKHCENVAQTLAKMMSKYKRELTSVRRAERKSLLKELYNDAEGKMCPVLQYTVHFGVAYHHSGLTVDERRLLEEAYSAGTLCLLACTSTLAAGVNLPAKRVILRSPYVGMSFLSRSQYKQMVGRAGRAGIDTSGESILICKPADKDKVVELLSSPIENCHSSLVYDDGKGVRALLLSTIGLKITSSTDDVFKFVSRSLAHCQQEVLRTDILGMCRDSLQQLIDCDLVVQTKTQSENPEHEGVIHSLEVTPLGMATYKGPVDPDFARMLYQDLKKAEESIVLSTHLHLLYLITPYDVVKDMNPSWFIYFRQISTLDASELRVASLIGVPESYVARRASQQKSRTKVDEFVVTRFYLTLMLYDLWREKSVWVVAEKFQQPRGFIQNLLSSAASFASCVSHFCLELKEFWAYQDLLGNFVKRLSYCVTAELIPLMEIPGVKLGRARLMYTAGYNSLSSVALADPEDLMKSVQYMPRKVAKQIVASAKLLLNEKKDAMMEEVEALVTIPTVNLGDAVTIATIPTPAPVTPAPDSQSSVVSDS